MSPNAVTVRVTRRSPRNAGRKASNSSSLSWREPSQVTCKRVMWASSPSAIASATRKAQADWEPPRMGRRMCFTSFQLAAVRMWGAGRIRMMLQGGFCNRGLSNGPKAVSRRPSPGQPRSKASARSSITLSQMPSQSSRATRTIGRIRVPPSPCSSRTLSRCWRTRIASPVASLKECPSGTGTT